MSKCDLEVRIIRLYNSKRPQCNHGHSMSQFVSYSRENSAKAAGTTVSHNSAEQQQ